MGSKVSSDRVETTTRPRTFSETVGSHEQAAGKYTMEIKGYAMLHLFTSQFWDTWKLDANSNVGQGHAIRVELASTPTANLENFVY